MMKMKMSEKKTDIVEDGLKKKKILFNNFFFSKRVIFLNFINCYNMIITPWSIFFLSGSSKIFF